MCWERSWDGHMCLGTRWLALPCVHTPVTVGDTSAGHRGRIFASGVGPVSSQWGSRSLGGIHPSPGWDGGRDHRPWRGRADSRGCWVWPSSGRKLVPTRPGWDLVTCKLGLETRSCWGSVCGGCPGVSLGQPLSCCCRRRLERGFEGQQGRPLAGTASGRDGHAPAGSWSAGDRNLCQRA